ncbi:UDP-glucose/GDP-mannose dehydrogenase family protein [Bacteroidia bacterium]|nr:UDP-glucose/GDP-mannose dehydrogenase family protein [Bacteroidia bacterium]MDB4107040.1 UDP-glucose/GDP-mannose dehydrogenase family protein [Bacteroidia bacterium]MDB9882488.1 UDP-glucose/GDP-mannose dehydrogenase family protein [Bacteroidia bacterium]
MKIAVVGTGYVGLVTGTCLAEVGTDVTCIDIDKNKIEGLKNGIMPIYEPGLEALVKRNYSKERLHFSIDLAQSIVGSDVAFIAVGTPPGEDGSADLQYVLGVAAEIGRNMNGYGVIVTKSTVPVGTAEKVRSAVQEELDKRGVEIDFDIASNPEFLKEGAAIHDFMKPDRIVVGVDSERAQEVMSKLYKPFIMNGHPLIFMDIPSAEMTKYAANAMLATRISFMNDIANLCEIMGADVNAVRKGIGSDPRIGSRFIYAGIGYGGSCFPKDVKALIKTGAQNDYRMRILESVEEVNDEQKSVLFNKIVNSIGSDLSGKTFAMWGLSFKPNTDDMREAPSLVLIDKILNAGGKVVAYDPVSMPETKHMIGDKIEYVDDQYSALDNAEALLIVTEWSEFKIPDFDEFEKRLKNKLVFDGRNIYDKKEMREMGYEYHCIGSN